MGPFPTLSPSSLSPSLFDLFFLNFIPANTNSSQTYFQKVLVMASSLYQLLDPRETTVGVLVWVLLVVRWLLILIDATHSLGSFSTPCSHAKLQKSIQLFSNFFQILVTSQLD